MSNRWVMIATTTLMVIIITCPHETRGQDRVFQINYGDPIGTKVWRFDGNGDGTWTATILDPPPAFTNP